MPAAPLPFPPAKILLATDLSCRCDRALDRAVWLARAWNAALVIVHVLEPRPEDSVRGEDIPSWRRPPERAAVVERQIRSDMIGALHSVIVRVEDGDPAKRIAEIAREEGCGLIVTGVARDQTFERALLGATVDRLIRNAPAPVLVVRARAKAAYEKIVVATDFSVSSRYALDTASRHFANAEIALLHAFHVPFEGLTTSTDIRQQSREQLQIEADAFMAKWDASDQLKRRVQVLIEHGAPEPLLQALVDDGKADLIVIGSHGRSAVFDILIGSTAKRIMESARADVLLVREPRAGG